MAKLPDPDRPGKIMGAKWLRESSDRYWELYKAGKPLPKINIPPHKNPTKRTVKPAYRPTYIPDLSAVYTKLGEAMKKERA
jgi:hypothetical protein